MNIFLYNPTGNRTILVEGPVPDEDRKTFAEDLMAKEPSAEQLGFLLPGDDDADLVLEMAGGEFCGNASMSAAAHYAMRHPGFQGFVTLRVSGAADPVKVWLEPAGKGYCGSVYMPLPESVEPVTLNGFTLPLVRFAGISHLISDGILTKAEAENNIRSWCASLNCSCLGIMLYDRTRSALTPLVYVPGADTLFWETSCASGSSAAGAWLHQQAGCPVSVDFAQPGGILHVEADGTVLILQGYTELEKKL